MSGGVERSKKHGKYLHKVREGVIPIKSGFANLLHVLKKKGGYDNLEGTILKRHSASTATFLINLTLTYLCFKHKRYRLPPTGER